MERGKWPVFKGMDNPMAAIFAHPVGEKNLPSLPDSNISAGHPYRMIVCGVGLTNLL